MIFFFCFLLSSVCYRLKNVPTSILTIVTPTSDTLFEMPWINQPTIVHKVYNFFLIIQRNISGNTLEVHR